MRSFATMKFAVVLLTLSLSVQFLGCGAAEISSAKLYRNQRNYVKANELLEQAIKKEPDSDEAWTLYVQNLYDLKMYEVIADKIDTAAHYAITHRPDVELVRFNTWVSLYNGGADAFTQNEFGKENQQAAIGLLESARKLLPARAETYDMLGRVYEAAGDTAKSIETYKEELKYVGSAHTQGVNMGLMLRMNPAAVERAMGGAPARQSKVQISASDSALVYVYPSRQAYVYFTKNAKPPYGWELIGWRFTDNEVEGMQPLAIATGAYQMIGNYYYTRGMAMLNQGKNDQAQTEMERGVPYLLTLQQIDPQDEFASTVIPDIYTRLNKVEKAKEQYEKALQANPTKQLYANYGNLLFRAEDYPGAIAVFERSLSLDPNYESALYNLGASYKNWAAAEQKAGKKDYKTKLEKSTEYFERLRTANPNDFNGLIQLTDNYVLLNKKDKQASLLTSLEAAKTGAGANDAVFWESIGKIYANLNRTADAQAAYAKADALRHK